MNENINDRIRESLNEIEIPDGAKERILANIRRKAAEQALPENRDKNKETDRKLPWNRVVKWALPIAACLVVAAIGAMFLPKLLRPSENLESGGRLEIANPFVSVENAECFKTALGITLDAPEGAENVQYSILDGKIADILFDFDGHTYTLRASELTGDFSGLNGNEERTELIDSEGSAMLTVIQSGDELYRKIVWTDGKVTFILSNMDGASDEEMKAVYGEIKMK